MGGALPRQAVDVLPGTPGFPGQDAPVHAVLIVALPPGMVEPVERLTVHQQVARVVVRRAVVLADSAVQLASGPGAHERHIGAAHRDDVTLDVIDGPAGHLRVPLAQGERPAATFAPVKTHRTPAFPARQASATGLRGGPGRLTVHPPGSGGTTVTRCFLGERRVARHVGGHQLV